MSVIFEDPRNRHSASASIAAFPAWADAISSWCAATSDEISLEAALTDLLAASGAEAGMIVHCNTRHRHQHVVALRDKLAAGAKPLRKSYAEQALGHHLECARTGTVWIQSAGDPFDAGALAEFQAARQFRDFAVLVLSAAPTLRGHIELHFRRPVPPEMQTIFCGLVNVLARHWAGHQLTLEAKHMTTLPLTRIPSREEPANILGPSNPARLSRAEFRVCLLLSRGLSVQGVCESLQLAETTVRSHLRNIYAKSGATRLAELIYLLTSSQRNAAVRPPARTA